MGEHGGSECIPSIRVVPSNGAPPARIFFSEFVRVSLKHPTQALFFARTVLWHGRAARRRARMAGEGVHVPPIAIFSVTKGATYRKEAATPTQVLTPPLLPAPWRHLMQGQNSSHDTQTAVRSAASLIRGARYLTAFTGAGISVESGIPPFRGPGGLWGKYDPRTLELSYFLGNPAAAWPTIREIFYDNFGKAKPNKAHEVLARLEAAGMLKTLVTQNIDNLHGIAGSRNIVEFHGNSAKLLCLSCGTRVAAAPALLTNLPPRCPCGGIYKPDFVFFGEGIPADAHAKAEEAARRSDVMLVIGSTGEVYPAALVPRWAFEAGARIIEVNPGKSEFTETLKTLHIALPAGEAFALIEKELFP